MKRCSKCGIEKDESEFGILSNSKDGLAYRCKVCNREMARVYRETHREQIRKTQAKYRQTKKYKATRRRYYYSEKGQAAAKRWMQKAKDTGKAKAREAVNHAVEKGYMPRASECKCAMDDGTCYGPMEYHHKSYSKNNWLNVVPLCRKHHLLLHGIDCHF